MKLYALVKEPVPPSSPLELYGGRENIEHVCDYTLLKELIRRGVLKAIPDEAYTEKTKKVIE